MLNNQDFTTNRSKYLGGSDIGAILGFSKYRTALDVWLEKTGRETNEVDTYRYALALLPKNLSLVNMPPRPNMLWCITPKE